MPFFVLFEKKAQKSSKEVQKGVQKYLFGASQGVPRGVPGVQISDFHLFRLFFLSFSGNNGKLRHLGAFSMAILRLPWAREPKGPQKVVF